MEDDRTKTLVLQEFRLTAVDTDGAVARIVDTLPGGAEPSVPLLTNIDDPHDVATIQTLRAGEPEAPEAAQRRALDPFVSSWRPTKRYRSRIAERSQTPPTHYRLAVTESGINDAKSDAAPVDPGGAPDGSFSPIDLLVVARPVVSHGGLLILVGTHDGARVPALAPPDPGVWPLPMSRGLGVRIYDSGA